MCNLGYAHKLSFLGEAGRAQLWKLGLREQKKLLFHSKPNTPLLRVMHFFSLNNSKNTNTYAYKITHTFTHIKLWIWWNISDGIYQFVFIGILKKMRLLWKNLKKIFSFWTYSTVTTLSSNKSLTKWKRRFMCLDLFDDLV